MSRCRVMHIHFGREGGAERFFVSLARQLAERGVEQRFIIRPGRTWHGDVADLGPVIRSDFTDVIRMTGHVQSRRMSWARKWRPHAYMARMSRAAKLLPARAGVPRVTRPGDFPKDLRHFGRTDVPVANTPGIGERIRSLGWRREVRVITDFPMVGCICGIVPDSARRGFPTDFPMVG